LLNPGMNLCVAATPPRTNSSRQSATPDSEQSVWVEIPLNRAIADAMSRVERTQVPELADRIIAATALHLNVPVITRDRKIQASNLQTIW
jgi:predicted nucleic acid-binding protein